MGVTPAQELRRALSLAQENRGFCAPNPSVGAIVWDAQGNPVGEGAHMGPGTAHGEALALQRAGEKARGGTLFVSLEPCNHWGRTPPCTDAILNSGVRQVYYAASDPNPEVAGGGAHLLREKGVECQQLALPEAQLFYESYRGWLKTRRPFVTVKLALTLDGKYAENEGPRLKLTGNEATQWTHQQRRHADALLSTAQTVLQDNPRFDVRLPHLPALSKPLYLLDSQTRLTGQEAVFSFSQVRSLFCHQEVLSPLPYRSVPGQSGALDLEAVLAAIGQDGVHDLWVEAGGSLTTELLQKNCVDRLFLLVAPHWWGEPGRSAFPFERLRFLHADGTIPTHIQWQTLGQDVVLEIRWK